MENHAEDAKKRDMRGQNAEDYFERTNLTKNQMFIWMEQKMYPDTSLYNMASTFAFSGKIDVAHFRSAFQELINHNDALRTVIREIDTIPIQKALPPFAYELEFIDLSTQEQPKQKARALLKQRCLRRFHLEQILFDSVLVKCSESFFIWYFCQHHVIGDAWSNILVYRRLVKLYESSLQGRLYLETHSYPQFQEYVALEKAYRGSAQYLRDQIYWQQRLFKEKEILKYYGKTSEKRIAPADRKIYDLGTERTHQIKVLARSTSPLSLTLDMSLSLIFTALFVAYLYRISGAETLSVGIPFHNRPSEKSKMTIGMLMEVCPLFINVTSDTPFSELLKHVNAEIISSLRHYRYVTGNAYHQKTYDAMVNYHHMSIPPLTGMQPRYEWILADAVNVNISLQVFNFVEVDNIFLGFDFNADIFTGEQQHFAIQHFLHIFDAFLRNPDQLVGQVALLTQEEYERIIVQENQTQTVYPRDRSLAGLIEDHVLRQPQKLAVISETQTLTYMQLNKKANQLAKYLQQQGVELETRVAVCMHRSQEMVVGLLGVLKAGGTYIPLDPAYPQDRLIFMLHNAQVSVLLLQKQFFADMPNLNGITTICIEDALEASMREDYDNPLVPIQPENLAYIIYTSGSTGMPKGVAITHRGIVNNITDLNRRFCIGKGDSVLNLSSLSFDMSVYETFGILSAGGTVILPYMEKNRDPQHWLELINRHQVTIWNSAPPLLDLFVTHIESHKESRPSSLRLVLLGGDWIPLTLPNRLRKLVDPIEVIGLGGATEASIHSIIYPIHFIDPAWNSIPYGRPMANQSAYILDRYLNPSPIGVPGQLYLGGVGLARGYFNQPDMTAERFLPDPFYPNGGVCMYKTGDLARYLADGTIELLGRIDHQVKIRGFRIELGEVEAALKLHPHLQDAVVLARENVNSEKALVAYVVQKTSFPHSETDVQAFLGNILPSYMVPSTIVFLEKLPLTSNGKIDRLHLPTPDSSSHAVKSPLAEPRNSLEVLIAGLWMDVLGLGYVDIYDNFFKLGGHSLSVMRVLAHLQDIFTVSLPLNTLFEKPTIASLAEYLQLQCLQHNIDAANVAEIALRVKQMTDDDVLNLLTRDS